MNKRVFTVGYWIVALLPVAALALCYSALPDRVPIQWGLGGAVRYGGKGALLFLFLLSPVLAAVLRLLPKIDPRKGSYARFQGYYDGLCAAVLLLLAVMDAVVLTESFRPGTCSVWRLITLAVGLLLVFIGNLMPKVKANFFVGFKNPWTLSDPDVWNRTNRLGGILFFAMGLALCAAGVLFSEQTAFAVLLAGVALAVLLPNVLSYIWYRQKVDSRGGE